MGEKMLKLVFHHGGDLVFNEKAEYIGGTVDVVAENFDVDHLSYVNLLSYLKDLGYVTVKCLWVYIESTGEFSLVVSDQILTYIGQNLNDRDSLDIYVEGGIRLFPNVHSQISDVLSQSLNVNVIQENYDVSYSSDEDDELQQARENIRKKIEEQRLRESRNKNVPEEVEDLPELFFEVDDLGDGHDEEGEKECAKEFEKERREDGDEVGSIVSDDEEGIGLTNSNRSILFDEKTPIPVFCVRMAFINVKQLRRAIAKYAIVKGVGLKFKKNEPKRVRVHCVAGCPWKLFVSEERNTETLEVKTYTSNHRCYRVSNQLMATSDHLAYLLKDTLVSQPHMKLRDIKTFCKSQWKIKIGWTVAHRVKQKVMQELMGDYEAQFADLHNYVNEVLHSNPGSTCVVQTCTLDPAERNQFLRFYVCFKACKDGWVEGCRKIIGVDGCFLKGLCEGQLLCAIGKDANQQMFPIAWAVVSHENAYNWGWFLKLLKHDLPLGDGEGYTIISDMQKGLDKAIREELPQVYHRWCARHIYAAWAKTWRGQERKKWFWRCAKSTSEGQLQKNIDKLAELGKDIILDMIEYPLHTWVKAFFPTNTKCDMVENNISETFNGWILDSRWKPIISMLDEIRRQVMVRLAKKKEFAKTWICDISPMAMKRLEKAKSKSYSWEMVFNGEDGYEVLNIYNTQVRHVVSLQNRTCSCRAWDVSGIPCKHAVAVIYNQKKEPEHFVSHWYSKEMYLKAYSHVMYPLRGKENWERLNCEPILPPLYKAKPGRPKRNRRKDPDEPKNSGKASRAGRKMTCSLCGEQGHNKKGCPQRPRGPQVAQNEQIRPRRGSWMLRQGERDMCRDNANSFLQRSSLTQNTQRSQHTTGQPAMTTIQPDEMTSGKRKRADS